jgi:hypothetical protein
MSEPYFAPVRGVVSIFGGHDSGKTSAALGANGNPETTHFIDSDLKGGATAQQLREAGVQFGGYYDMTPHFSGMKPTENYAVKFRETIFGLPEHTDLIVVDNWQPVYESLRMHVDNNRPSFKDIIKWSPNSTINNGLVSKVARRLEEALLQELSRRSKLVIVTHHLKDRYVQNVVVGKVPEASKLFDRVCVMRIWLRHNPASPVPIILFPKRPNKPMLVDGQLRFENYLPRRAVPLQTERSIWDTIERYHADPIGNRLPSPNETPNEYELAMMAGVLSADAKRTLETALALASVARTAEIDDDPESTSMPADINAANDLVSIPLDTRVEDLQAEGKSLAEMMGILNKEGRKVTPPQILKVINNGE